MNRNKASNLLNDGITPIVRDRLNEILLNQKYSIIIDETTDISKTKLMAIVAQIWEKNYGPRFMLYGMVDCSQAQDAESMFSIVADKILNKPFSQNLVGYSSDGAHSMRGRKYEKSQHSCLHENSCLLFTKDK